MKEASAEQAQEHETVETTSTATSHQKIMVVIPQQSLKLPKKKIDLTQVTGTGRDGRITRKDVTNFTPTQARTPEKTVSPELALQFQRSQLLRKMKAPQQLVQLKQPQIKLSLQILYVKQLLKNGPKCQRNPSRLVNGGSGCDQLSPT